MNLTDAKYGDFELVRDMMAATDVVASFDTQQTRDVAAQIALTGRLFMTG